MSTNIPPVDAAIEILGGPTKAAAALGIKNPSVVMNWKARGQVPADKAVDVETLTGISRHVLRPDVFKAAPTERAS
jgi:DNA-binding transcriptional regulator YdaS (Cro superfamily)